MTASHPRSKRQVNSDHEMSMDDGIGAQPYARTLAATQELIKQVKGKFRTDQSEEEIAQIRDGYQKLLTELQCKLGR